MLLIPQSLARLPADSCIPVYYILSLLLTYALVPASYNWSTNPSGCYRTSISGTEVYYRMHNSGTHACDTSAGAKKLTLECTNLLA